MKEWHGDFSKNSQNQNICGVRPGELTVFVASGQQGTSMYTNSPGLGVSNQGPGAHWDAEHRAKCEEDRLLREFVYHDETLWKEFQVFKAMEKIKGGFSD